MIAGLPGTGIGGLFYIATALWMPVHRVLSRQGGPARTPRRMLLQMAMACGILGALALTAAGLGMVITPADPAGVGNVRGAVQAAQSAALFRWIALLGTAGVLSLVLLTVQVARLVVRRGRVRYVRAGDPAAQLPLPEVP